MLCGNMASCSIFTICLTATDNPSSVATTVQAEEETRGKKRPHDDSSSDNDSCYSTPNESPRDGSLGSYLYHRQ